MIALWALAAAVAGPLRGPDGAATGRELGAAELFTPAGPGWSGELPVRTDPAALGAVAMASAAWLRAAQGRAPSAAPGLPAELGLDADATLATLDFIARVAAEDAGAPAQRLLDPAFIERHFELWRWQADAAGLRKAGLAPQDGKIRITRYYVLQVDGSPIRTSTYSAALYADPGDGARERFTRPEVMAGAWAGGGASPLVWLRPADVYEAQLQGTVEVQLPDGARRTFNVHRHNGRAYQRGTSREAQPRWWYHREVQAALGWGEPDRCPDCDKIELQPHVAVAGDVWNLGPGRLLWIETPAGPRLAVLADSGGAFQPNLHQLDWYGGPHPSPEALYAATRELPGWARAGLLTLRRPAP